MSIKQEATFQLGVQLKRVGLYEEAMEAFEQAQMGRHSESMTVNTQIDLFSELGDLSLKLGWLDRARKSFNSALALIESTDNGDVPGRAHILFGLACVHHHRQEHEQAKSLMFYVLGMQKEQTPKGSVSMARTVHMLAEHYRVTEQYKDANQMYEAALLMQRSFLGEDDPEYLATAHDFSNYLAATGHLEDAADQLREVVRRRTRVLGSSHPDVVSSLQLLSQIYIRQKCFDEAEETLDMAKVLVSYL